jgi:hypothetical protein
MSVTGAAGLSDWQKSDINKICRDSTVILKYVTHAGHLESLAEAA